jgi:hypothetical protein
MAAFVAVVERPGPRSWGRALWARAARPRRSESPQDLPENCHMQIYAPLRQTASRTAPFTADVVTAALRCGACLRISGAGLAPNVIQSYASAAKNGGSHVIILMGDVAPRHHVTEAIGAAGRGHDILDFVASP